MLMFVATVENEQLKVPEELDKNSHRLPVNQVLGLDE